MYKNGFGIKKNYNGWYAIKANQKPKPLFFFYMNGFGVKETSKFNKPLNKETKCIMSSIRIFWTRHPYGAMVLFTNPSARAGYDTRSIFKRSLTGLNSEFSFS